MKRDELITKMATDADISKKAAKTALKSLLEGITLSLEKGDKVSFVGFGSFSVSHRQERKGINPATKAKIVIPARDVPVFKAGRNHKLKSISVP